MKKRFFQWLQLLIDKYNAKEKEKWRLRKEALARIPLVQVTTLMINSVSYRVLEVQKPGLLIDIIRAGSNAPIKKITWSGCTYSIDHEGPGIEEDVYIALANAQIPLLTETDVRRIISHGRLVHHTVAQKDHDIYTRIANVFLTRTLLPRQENKAVFHTPTHWQVGINVLSPTLFMSEYGAGTKVFMAAH